MYVEKWDIIFVSHYIIINMKTNKTGDESDPSKNHIYSF